MYSWDTNEAGRNARILATRKFLDNLKDLLPADRKKYTIPNADEAAASRNAKELFAKDFFYLQENQDAPPDMKPIPSNLKFRVYERGFEEVAQTRPTFHDRDDIVTMVLPRPGEVLKPDALMEYYYRCSYWPY